MNENNRLLEIKIKNSYDKLKTYPDNFYGIFLLMLILLYMNYIDFFIEYSLLFLMIFIFMLISYFPLYKMKYKAVFFDDGILIYKNFFTTSTFFERITNNDSMNYQDYFFYDKTSYYKIVKNKIIIGKKKTLINRKTFYSKASIRNLSRKEIFEISDILNKKGVSKTN